MTNQELAERLLSRLPTLLQAGPNIRRIFEALGKELVVMESATRRLLQSRWYTLARSFRLEDSLAQKATAELGSIGALFGLQPGAGESAEYFRQHLAALLRTHARGLSTARAVLELVSLVYLAEQPPVIEVEKGLTVGRFKVRNQDGSERLLRVELVDNPVAATAARFLAVQANQQVVTRNAGLEDELPRIELTAAAGDVTVPLLHQEESGLDIIFLGTIAKGQTLTLRHGQLALLDGKPASGVVLIANPTRFAGSLTDGHVFRFNTPEARFSMCKVDNRLPPLLKGETSWHYRTMSRSELRGYLAWSPELSAYVERAFEQPTSPPVDLTFRWREVTPAAFELRIPVDYIPPHYLEPSRDRGERGWTGFFRDIQAAVEYGRAAGVRATIGLSLPLPTEAITLQEKAPGMTAELRFTEQQLASDQPPASELALRLQDTVPAPRDSLGVGGIFNKSQFTGTTRFQ